MADPKDVKSPGNTDRTDTALDQAVLDWIVGGATNSHGCPACPHNAFGGSMGNGSHILVDGTIFSGGAVTGKLRG